MKSRAKMIPFAMYRLPLRSRTVRGKKYFIVTVEEESRWGTFHCREKCLVNPLNELQVIFIAESKKPSPRQLWITILCIVLEDIDIIPYNILYEKERYRRPIPMKFSSQEKAIDSLKDIGFTDTEIKAVKESASKINGELKGFQKITIPKDLYKKLTKK